MLRIIRIGTFINSLNIHRDLKAVLKMMKLTFYMVLWIHVKACILNQVTDKNWVPPLDFIDVSQSDIRS